MDAEFLRQDITEPDFLDNLLKKLKGQQIDVVCGGPPCQSFSLAGKRKKFDKKDDLFAHYLNVIRVLRPKYFVMELTFLQRFLVQAHQLEGRFMKIDRQLGRTTL
jgi:DNA (cytosine-5)-methyltransferase 1